MSAPGNRKCSYSSPVVLVGGGDVSIDLICMLSQRGWPVICADGGADQLRNTAVRPDRVIGDMDSISDMQAWRETATVMTISEQNTTDFEKCLYTVEAPLYVADGFTGSRFDHTLASLHTMYKYLQTHRIIMTAGQDVCVGCRADFAMTLTAGMRFSIYPLAPTQFTSSSGLKYPLDGLLLEQGGMIGTSNHTVENRVELQIEYGAYVVIVPAASLPMLLDEVIG